MSVVSKAELARVSPDGRGIKPLRGLGSSYNSTGTEGIQHTTRGQKSSLMNGFSVSTFTLHLKQVEKTGDKISLIHANIVAQGYNPSISSQANILSQTNAQAHQYIYQFMVKSFAGIHVVSDASIVR